MQRQQRKKKKPKVFTLMSCTASNINWMINIKFTIFKLVFIFTVVAQVFLMHPKNGKRKTKIYYRKSTNKQINRRMCLYLYVYGGINNNKINEELSIQYFCYFAYNHIINVTVQFCECHRCCEWAQFIVTVRIEHNGDVYSKGPHLNWLLWLEIACVVFVL